MKRITYITAILIIAVVAISSCDGVRREPGRIYMPDMAYSRAYESFAERDSAKFTMDMYNKGGDKIFYNNVPPSGTIKRGELFPYILPSDTTGSYAQSSALKNPYDTITISKAQMAEAGRLYNVNCAICHGAKGLANGPIAKNGVGGVANLTTDAYVKMADGTMFHSISYGKGVMGSYASQVTRAQRWMIIKYIRTLQPKVETAKAGSDTTAKKKI
jgi:mono/diheme cytochrome c family protein